MKNIIKKEIHLLTPEGLITSPLRIEEIYHDTDLTVKKIFPDETDMYLTYNDTVFHGRGTDYDYFYTKALADLQVNLPEGISVCCCLTCRHGNMCPYGNGPDQLWCTKDIIINSKKDVCLLFEDEDCDSREVSSFGYCGCFSYQNSDDYTYNDFIYDLQKRRKSDSNV